MVIVHLVGRLAVKGPMWPGLVVERQVARQALMRSLSRLVGVQIDLLVFDTFPESFHKHVIAPAPFAVHADLNAVVGQQPCERLAGELAPLIGVEDLGTAILRDGLSYGLKAEVRRERIGQPPRQHPATRPVQDGEEIHEAALHGNIRDICRPDVIGTTDREIAEKIRIDGVGRMPPTERRFAIQGLDPHAAHQRGHLAPANGTALLP